MNILLVLPRIFANLSEPEHFPIGMAYVSSSLKKAGNNVQILNLNLEEGSVKSLIRDRINKYNIEIVEVGGLVTHYWMVKEVLDSVKEIDPKIYTLVGGGIVTGDPELAMEALQSADFGVFGEGEITNNEVTRAINGEIKYSEVNGLIYRARFEDVCADKFACRKNLPREEIKDLDSIPWPDYEGFNLGKMLELAPKRYVTMSTGRSCMFHCTFCFHTSGQKYRQRSLDGFFDELNYLVDNYRIDNIYITDELFANDKDRLFEFCDRIKNYDILWSIQLRVNVVTKELLMLLKNSGCIIISLGLESADNRVLKSMKKGITIEMIERALKCCKDVGIEAHGAFIFGDIAENEETIENTLTWWRNHREYNIGLALIQVYPGTFLYQYACEKGIISDKVRFIQQGCPYINVSQLNDKEYKKLGERLFRETIEFYSDLEKESIISEDRFQKNRINIECVCPNCGGRFFGRRLSTNRPAVLKCDACGRRYTYNPFLHFRETVSNNINKILNHSNEKNVVFWELNDIFFALKRAIPELDDVNYEIISSNNVMCGYEIDDHTVKSEELLLDAFYDTVIVLDYAFATYYENYIKLRYDNKMVIDIGLLTME